MATANGDFVVSFRVGLKLIVTGMGVVVGLNGGVVHTVQLGANCLPGTECQAWTETTAATRELPGGNAWDLYSPVGFRRH